jgi:hypothetical protein
MDTFGFSLLPAAAEAGLDTLTVSRHMPLFRRAVHRHDTTLVLAPCTLPDRLVTGNGLLLLLTRAQLVVTRHRRLPDRVRPHVAAPLADLSGVRWAPRPLAGVIDLRFHHAGRDHHLWVRTRYPGQLARLGSVFGDLFPAPIPRQRPTPVPSPASTRTPAPVPTAPPAPAPVPGQTSGPNRSPAGRLLLVWSANTADHPI